MLVAELARNPVSGSLGGDRVQPEPLRDSLPDGRALKEVECPRAGGDLQHRLGREHLDPADDAFDPTAELSVDLVREAHHRDGQRDIRFDGRDDVRGRRIAALEQAQHGVP